MQRNDIKIPQFIFLLFFLFTLHAQATTLNNSGEVFRLSEQPVFYKEPDGFTRSKMIEHLKSGNVDQFKQLNNLGYASGAYWTVKKIINNSDTSDWILHFGDSDVNELSLYIVGDKTRHQNEDFSTRSDSNNLLPTGIAFKTNLPIGKPVLIMIRTDANVYDQTASITLMKASIYKNWSMKNSLIYLLILGGMLSLTLYSLLLFFLVRDKSYGWYGLFSLSVFIFVLKIYGYFYPLFGFSYIDRRYDYIAFSSITVFGLIFVYHLLDINSISRKLGRFILSLGIFITISLFFAFFSGPVLFSQIAGIENFLVIIISIALSIIGIRHKKPASWYLLLAWIPLLINLILALWNIVFSYVSAVSFDLILVAITNMFLQLIIFLLAVVNKINIYQKQTILAENANHEKSRIIATASHDLRQPLHSMGLFIDALNYCKDESERTEIYPKLTRCHESLTHLFDGLLDISKLDSGTIKPSKEPIVIDHIFSNVVKQFELDAKQNNIHLHFRESGSIIYSDPVLIERIINNLVSNSIRYTEEGKVLLSCRSRKNNYLVQVWDTGYGINAAQQDQIFDEFTQLKSFNNRENQGLGLGLAIVKRLCLLLDHPICLSSRPGHGSVFGIEVAKGKISTNSIPVENDITIQDISDLKILVIDDDKEIRIAMNAMLSKWGYEVIEADSLETAIEIIEIESIFPDILLADYRLNNGKTGIEVIQEFHSRYNSNIPTLLITGDTTIDKIVELNNSNIPVIYKPVKPAKLRIVLNSLINA